MVAQKTKDNTLEKTVPNGVQAARELQQSRMMAARTGKRCDGLRGETVELALMTCKYKKGGAELRYRLSELKFDVKAGRLEVPGKGNASSADIFNDDFSCEVLYEHYQDLQVVVRKKHHS